MAGTSEVKVKDILELRQCCCGSQLRLEEKWRLSSATGYDPSKEEWVPLETLECETTLRCSDCKGVPMSYERLSENPVTKGDKQVRIDILGDKYGVLIGHLLI